MNTLRQKLGFFFPTNDLKETLQRFPLSVVCALALFALSVGTTHGFFKSDMNEVIARLGAIFVCGYFWFGAVRLFIESRAMAQAPVLLVSVLIFAVAAYLIFSSPQFMLHIAFLIPAFLLLISVGPFTKQDDNNSFWFFNHTLWSGVSVAMLAGLILWGGISAALASIQYLFDVNISYKIYSDIGALACIVIAPLNALSSVPRRFTFTAEECKAIPGLTFLINWILAPLILFYLLILYAYFIKILVMQEVPRGQIAYMTMGFAGTGIMAYLISWALKDRGNSMLRLFHKYFFPALIIPVCVMAFAAGERISQYGVTEQRYAVALAAIWLGLMAVAYTFRNLPLKFMPASLAVVLLLASFGPWSATSVSAYSQTKRLENLLTRNQILQDGKIVKTKADIPLQDRQNISSIVDYMYHTERQEIFADWGMKLEDDKAYQKTSYQIVQDMGFEYVSPYGNVAAPQQVFNYYKQVGGTVTQVSGYDYALTQINLYKGTDWNSEGSPAVKIHQQDHILQLTFEGRQIDLDLGNFLKKYTDEKNTIEKQLPSLDVENEALKVSLILNAANGAILGGVPQPDYVGLDLLVKVK